MFLTKFNSDQSACWYKDRTFYNTDLDAFLAYSTQKWRKHRNQTCHMCGQLTARVRGIAYWP